MRRKLARQQQEKLDRARRKNMGIGLVFWVLVLIVGGLMFWLFGGAR